MIAYRLFSGWCRRDLFATLTRIGALAGFVVMITAVCAGAVEETFLESEGEIFTVVDGKVGTQCTGKIAAISETQIEIMDKESNRKSYVIGKDTRICDRRNEPISVKDFTAGELVTIATADDNKGKAAGIRKGPILIRLTNMRPVPIGH